MTADVCTLLAAGTLDGFGFDQHDEGEPQSQATPVTASGPADSDAEEDTKQKKKLQVFNRLQHGKHI
jgi:hypothetical protein